MLINGLDPEAYVLDSQNVKLYQSVLEAMDEKDISELRIAQFQDRRMMFFTTLNRRLVGV